MPLKFATKFRATLHTPVEDTLAPAILRKAGIAANRDLQNEIASYLRCCAGAKASFEGTYSRDQLRKLLPLISENMMEASQEKTGALKKSCAANDKGLERWSISAMIESIAGGAIAIAFIPASLPLYLAALTDSSASDKSCVAFGMTILGGIISGAAAWAGSRINEARATVSYLSESAAFLAEKTLPADAKAREFESETEAFLKRMKKEAAENDALWKLSAAEKMNKLPHLSWMAASLFGAALEQASNSVASLSKAQKEIASLEKKAEEAGKLSGSMGENGRFCLQSSRRHLAEIKTIHASLEKTIDSVVESAKRFHKTESTDNMPAEMGISVAVSFAKAGSLFASNSMLEQMPGSKEKVLQQFAIDQSEHDVFALARMLERQLELEVRTAPEHGLVVGCIANALETVSEQYMKAISGLRNLGASPQELDYTLALSSILIAQCQAAIRKVAGQN